MKALQLANRNTAGRVVNCGPVIFLMLIYINTAMSLFCIQTVN